MTEKKPEAWGIEPGYHDVFGRWHEAAADTQSRLRDALSQGRGEPSQPHVPAQNGLRAFQGDEARIWGLAIQLYSLRSKRNWGIGDFSDLKSVIQAAARSGAGAVGLNPLHALFLDDPERVSPYAPNSRLFLNPLYIDVEAIREFPGTAEAGLQAQIEALRESELVDYTAVTAVKLKGLQSAYECFLADAGSTRKKAFAEFRAEQGEALLRFSCFEVLRRQHGSSWWREWREPWRNPNSAKLEEFRHSHERECGLYEFMQWVADEQLRACKELTRKCRMPVGLYLDLAVGVDPGGADAWSNQAAVLTEYSVGAPPDEFNPGGQDWGLAPFNPHALSDNDFAVFRQLLGSVMRHAGAVRLDHVLGLMRLYVIPHGAGAAEGAYVRFPFESLLRVVAEESHRYHCIFIGEDLGTVPEGFREVAGHWGVWTYRVMLFERWGDGQFKPPSEYPAEALATFNTHDLPSFRGWMSGHDLSTKRSIGLDPGESDEGREHARNALRHTLGHTRDHASDDFAAAASFLAATPARLVMVAVEDLLGVMEQVNIPGTIDQHPNWRRKLPVPVEAWKNQPEWKRVAEAFKQGGRAIAE